MTYQISGLSSAAFANREQLIAAGAVAVIADQPDAFPCRVTLEDAQPGDRLLLINFVSADVRTPFRASHAIFVREGAQQVGYYRDHVPPLIERRITSLRAFGRAGMMLNAVLAVPGEADARLRLMLENDAVTHVDIHAAAWGCFLARAERDDA